MDKLRRRKTGGAGSGSSSAKLVEARRAEALRATGVLGMQEVVSLEYRDGELSVAERFRYPTTLDQRPMTKREMKCRAMAARSVFDHWA